MMVPKTSHAHNNLFFDFFIYIFIFNFFFFRFSFERLIAEPTSVDCFDIVLSEHIFALFLLFLLLPWLFVPFFYCLTL